MSKNKHDEYTFFLNKTSAMLSVINTDLVFELMGRYGMSDDEIKQMVLNVSSEDMTNFVEEHELVMRHSNMLIVYLILLQRITQETEFHGKAYDC